MGDRLRLISWIAGCRLAGSSAPAGWRRSLAFYAAFGFQVEELDGYAVLRDGAAELHISPTPIPVWPPSPCSTRTTIV
jgi:hypothetical protein